MSLFNFSRQPERDTSTHALATALQTVVIRLDELEKAVKTLAAKATPVSDFLPILDRVQELALVAQGQPEIAREFGLTSRQRQTSNLHEDDASVWNQDDDVDWVG